MNVQTGSVSGSVAAVCYPPSIQEEELKNRVSADWFGAFDCSRILGKVDFCAGRTGFQPVQEINGRDARSHSDANGRDARSTSDVFTSAVADVYDRMGDGEF